MLQITTVESKQKRRVSKEINTHIQPILHTGCHRGKSPNSISYHNSRFRLLRSSGPSSSPSRSAVSAGFRRECTLLAMLLRRVGGPGVSRPVPLNGYRAPGNCHPASFVFAYEPPKLLVKEGAPVSCGGGGDGCLEPVLDGRGNSY